MDFKRENKKVGVLLPPRSLLVMSGEGRYAWSHGISPRHNDVVGNSNGVTTQPRGTRVSFTFRKVRKGDCPCSFPKYCDTREHSATILIDNKVAPEIENSYVHDVCLPENILQTSFICFQKMISLIYTQVYEQISSHFDETRHKRWPNVSKFLETLNFADILLDVGCGNGKYLHKEKHIFKVCIYCTVMSRIMTPCLIEFLPI